MKMNASNSSADSELDETTRICREIKIAKKKREQKARLLKHLFLIVFSFIMLYPLLWLTASSLKPETQIFGNLGLWPSEFQWSNYFDGWNALPMSFTVFYTNSVLVTVISVIGNLLSCSLAAYAFARLQFTGRNFFFALMMLTMMLPYHVVLIPQYILFLKLGWVDTYLPLVVPRFLAADGFFIFFNKSDLFLDVRADIRISWNSILGLACPVKPSCLKVISLYRLHRAQPILVSRSPPTGIPFVSIRA